MPCVGIILHIKVTVGVDYYFFFARAICLEQKPNELFTLIWVDDILNYRFLVFHLDLQFHSQWV